MTLFDSDAKPMSGVADRRRFLTAATGLGLVAATTTFGPRAAHAQAAAEELPPPKGIRPGAMLDCRFPVSYQTSVPAAMNVMVQYFAALASRDLRAIARQLHFPWAIYEGIEPLVYQTEAEFLANPPPSMNFTGRLKRAHLDRRLQGHGGLSILPGSFDMLDKLELHTFNPVNVGIELVFTRFSPTGERLERCEGIYGVTNNDGRWAMQLASTIFTPANPPGQLTTEYRDAAEAALRSSRDWMLGWSESSAKILQSRTSSPGRHASIGGGTNPTRTEGGYYPAQRGRRGVRGGGPYSSNFMDSAGVNQPMSIYGSKGVKSRLQVRGDRPATTTTTGTPAGFSEDYSEERFSAFNKSAAGGMGLYGYTHVLPNERILHATVNKAHSFGGYVRYTPESIMISETRSLGIETYVDGRWGSAGGFGQSIYRDSTNDAPE